MAVALCDKAIRDPASNGVTVAVILILGIALSGAVSLFALWPSSMLYRPDTVQKVFVLTLFGIAVWTVVAFLLLHTGPYRLQITTAVVVKYLTLAAYGSVGAFAFYMALFLCRKRSGHLR